MDGWMDGWMDGCFGKAAQRHVVIQPVAVNFNGYVIHININMLSKYKYKNHGNYNV